MDLKAKALLLPYLLCKRWLNKVQALYIGALSRFEFQLGHSNLIAAFDQKWNLTLFRPDLVTWRSYKCWFRPWLVGIGLRDTSFQITPLYSLWLLLKVIWLHHQNFIDFKNNVYFHNYLYAYTLYNVKLLIARN